MKPVFQSALREYFYLQTLDYRIPDVDGTETSCRCANGPHMYIWPPPNGPEDLLCSNSTYDLTLCVHVKSGTSPKLTMLQERLLRLQREDSDPVSEENGRTDYHKDLPTEENELLQWYELEGSKMNGGEGGYEMYPLAINLTDTIQAITEGLPAPFAPITNPSIRLLRVPRTACTPTSHSPTGDSKAPETYDLIVVYKTGVFHFDSRERIRAATRNLPRGVRVVFSIGQPRTDGGGSFYHMNGGFDLQLLERSGTVADLWANRSEEASRRLFEEAERFGDIIIGDYVDTYVNLTYKMLTSHRWASAFCQGSVIVDATNQALVPWSSLPVYVLGFAYLIGADILNELIIAEIYTRFLWVDDAYLGFVVAKLPWRKFQNIKGLYPAGNNSSKALVSPMPFKSTFAWVAETIKIQLYCLLF
ncbi:hypothetical protein Aperf_G00000083929 [Anoplocephala perfoliata]